MKKRLFVFTLLLLVCMMALFTACSKEERAYVYEASISNPGFERGDFSGWTVTGGFEVVESPNKSEKNEGRYFAKSSANGKGELVSEKFVLQDTGYVSFLIGAGDGDCYVAIYSGDTMIKQVCNPYLTNHCDGVLRRVLVNLEEYVGKEIYFKIVDNSENLLYSYIIVDAFDVNVTVTDKAVYKAVSQEV